MITENPLPPTSSGKNGAIWRIALSEPFPLAVTYVYVRSRSGKGLFRALHPNIAVFIDRALYARVRKIAFSLSLNKYRGFTNFAIWRYASSTPIPLASRTSSTLHLHFAQGLTACFWQAVFKPTAKCCATPHAKKVRFAFLPHKIRDIRDLLFDNVTSSLISMGTPDVARTNLCIVQDTSLRCQKRS